MARKQTTKRLGRRPLDGNEAMGTVLKIRLPAEMAGRLEEMRQARLDRPPISVLVRELLAKALEGEK